MAAFGSAWKWMKGEQVLLPTQARIDDSHVDVLAATPEAGDLTANRCYFVIHVNEMFLRDRRLWWKEYVPTLWTATEFGYGGAVHEIPGLVGPSLLKGNDLGVPEGMLYRNTRVAGMHPYRGGTVSFSLILNRVQSEDHVQQVLSIVETVGSAFSLAMNLTPYLAVARSVTRGLEVLLDLGSSPVMGVRDTLSPDLGASPGIRLGYYALLEDRVPSARLWVRDGGLCVGDTAETATPLRDRSYVLYNIAATPRRNDVDQLADLRELRQRVEEFAQRPGDDSWLTAKTSMTELGVRLRTHPDLITPQADELFREWVADMVALHKERVLEAPKSFDAGLAKLTVEQADIQQVSQYVMQLDV